MVCEPLASTVTTPEPLFLMSYIFPFIPTAVGRLIVTVPDVTSIVKSSSIAVYVEVIPVRGTVTPPRDIIPFLNINSFAIIFFFFHFPKEMHLLLNYKYVKFLDYV
jgi:hypothetical protein